MTKKKVDESKLKFHWCEHCDGHGFVMKEVDLGFELVD